MSLSDIFHKLPSGRANITEQTDGPTNWGDILGGRVGGILTLALLVMLVVLSIYRQLMDTANNLARSFRRQNPPSPPSRGRPRNLSDDEVLEMQARGCSPLAAEQGENAAPVPRGKVWM